MAMSSLTNKTQLLVESTRQETAKQTLVSEALSGPPLQKPIFNEEQRKAWRLKTILSVMFTLLAVTPIFFATQYMYDMRETELRNVKAQQLNAYSKAVKTGLMLSIAGIQERAELIGARRQLRETLAAWQVSQAPEALQALSAILGDVKGQVSGVENIALYDLKGKLVIGLNANTPLSMAVADHFKSTIELLPASKESTLLVEHSSYLRLNTKPIGTLIVTFNADFVETLLGNHDALGSTGEIILGKQLDSGEGVFISRGRYDQVNSFARYLNLSEGDSPMVQALLGNEQALSNTIDYAGHAVLAYTRYIPELKLGLVVKINESEIHELITQAFDGIYVMEAIVTILSVIVGLLVSTIIASPIEGLNTHIRNQKKGELPAPYYNFKGWHEVQSLTHNFNTMIDDIRQLNQELNHKVELRTKELEKANRTLQELVIRDPLTGLYNRRHIMEVMAHDLQQAKRYSIPFIVVMLDIDHFKEVNDTYGHPVGDRVLVEVARYLQDSARRSELVSRYGGEEFLIAFMATPEEDAQSLVDAVPDFMKYIDQIRHNIANMPFTFNGAPSQVTVSIGVAAVENLNDSVDDLIERADQALYEAKHQGRNRSILYTQNL